MLRASPVAVSLGILKEDRNNELLTECCSWMALGYVRHGLQASLSLSGVDAGVINLKHLRTPNKPKGADTIHHNIGALILT